MRHAHLPAVNLPPRDPDGVWREMPGDPGRGPGGMEVHRTHRWLGWAAHLFVAEDRAACPSPHRHTHAACHHDHDVFHRANALCMIDRGLCRCCASPCPLDASHPHAVADGLACAPPTVPFLCSALHRHAYHILHVAVGMCVLIADRHLLEHEQLPVEAPCQTRPCVSISARAALL